MVFDGVLNDLKWNFMEKSNCYLIDLFLFFFQKKASPLSWKNIKISTFTFMDEPSL